VESDDGEVPAADGEVEGWLPGLAGGVVFEVAGEPGAVGGRAVEGGAGVERSDACR
jgi:hypothetical protein